MYINFKTLQRQNKLASTLRDMCKEGDPTGATESTEFLLWQEVFERADQKMINHIINKLLVWY